MDVVRRVFKKDDVGIDEIHFSEKQFQLVWMLADIADSKKFWQYTVLKPWQKINHWPGIRELGNKRYLQANMRAARAKFGPNVIDCFPVSIVLPTERDVFEREFKRIDRESGGKGQMWMLKVGGKDRGQGISLISHPDQAPTKKRAIVQQYIRYPHLLYGHKYTIRAYVVITSFDPLRLYLYQDGLIHMAINEYNSDASSFKDRYAHLTNPDISKKHKTYAANPRPWYWSVRELMAYVEANGNPGDADLLWARYS